MCCGVCYVHILKHVVDCVWVIVRPILVVPYSQWIGLLHHRAQSWYRSTVVPWCFLRSDKVQTPLVSHLGDVETNFLLLFFPIGFSLASFCLAFEAARGAHFHMKLGHNHTMVCPAPCTSRGTSDERLHSTMIKLIMCQCLEQGCNHNVLYFSFCWKMVLVMVRLCFRAKSQ